MGKIGLSSLVLLGYLGLSTPQVFSQVKHQVYDTIARSFSNSPGGVNESLLNKLHPFLHYDSVPGALDLIQRYDCIERTCHFEPVTNDIFFEKRSFIHKIKKNNSILKNLEKKDFNKVRKKEKNLKRLMFEIDGLHKYIEKNNPGDELLKATETYGLISVRLKGYVQRDVHLTRSLLFVSNKKIGDCTDYSASLYSLMNFYGIDTHFKFGKMFVNDVFEGNHVWLSISTKEGVFDIDPNNMRMPVPLDERNKVDIKPEKIK